MHKVYVKCVEERSGGKSLSCKKPAERAAAYCGVSRNTVLAVARSFKKTGNPRVLGYAGRREKEDRCPVEFAAVVRRFVLERLRRGQVTNARDVRAMVAQELQVKASTRTIERWLHVHAGMEYCKRQVKALSYQEKLSMVAQRDSFLQQLEKYRQDGYDIVYQDETFIHHHHKLMYGWMTEETQHKAQSKGRRFVILHAGCGDYGWVQNALLIYQESGRGEYHGKLNGPLFVRWFTQQLLPNLRRRSVIVMDNAKYHKV